MAFAGVLLGLATIVTPVRADAIFRIENAGPFSPGSIATVGVFLASTLAAGENFSDFNVIIDLPGDGLPAGISAASVFLTNTLIPTRSPPPSEAGFDFNIVGEIVQGSTLPTMPPGTATSGGVKLFDMNFNIAAGFAPGTVVSVNFVNLGAFNFVSRNGTRINISSLNNGSFQVVPEPSTASFVALGLLGAVGFRRRRASF